MSFVCFENFFSGAFLSAVLSDCYQKPDFPCFRSHFVLSPFLRSLALASERLSAAL